MQQQVARKPRDRRRMVKKVCQFCVGKCKTVDYKDVNLLKKYISERGKILPPRATGCCSKHQRMLATAIKVARIVALLSSSTS